MSRKTIERTIDDFQKLLIGKKIRQFSFSKDSLRISVEEATNTTFIIRPEIVCAEFREDDTAQLTVSFTRPVRVVSDEETLIEFKE